VEFQVTVLDYNSSKTALVMVTSQYAKAFPAIRFNVRGGAAATVAIAVTSVLWREIS
jgi:hypothetical protein